jgi:hypothetical protein
MTITEARDRLVAAVDPGVERAGREAAVEHGLPGVDDDRGMPTQHVTGNADRVPRPVRAVIGDGDRPVERATPVGHDQQRHVGPMQQARGRRAQQRTRERAATAASADEHVGVPAGSTFRPAGAGVRGRMRVRGYTRARGVPRLRVRRTCVAIRVRVAVVRMTEHAIHQVGGSWAVAGASWRAGEGRVGVAAGMR